MARGYDRTPGGGSGGGGGVAPGTYASRIAPSGDATGFTDTTTIQAALNAASGATWQGRVQLGGGTFYTTGLTLPSNVALVGSGQGITEIKLAAGANADVIKGANFASLTLTGTAPFAGGVYNSLVADLLINGNSANQTGTSYGYRVYGYANKVRDVVIHDCYTTGIWHEGGALNAQDGANDPGSECEFRGIRIYRTGSHGFMLLGPSDCVLSDVTVGFANQNLNAVGIGFWAMADQRSNVLTTASGMNGVTVAGFTGTFTVNAAAFGNATDFYASTGTLAVTTSTGTATMTYTGKTATTFTGCTVTSGSGTFVTGNAVKTSGTQKFTTNGMAMSQVHAFGCGQSWGFVLDGTTTAVNCHSDGTAVGGVLCRGSVSWVGGEIYDFTPTTTSLGVQLGDAGSTLGVPLTASVNTSACDINTHVVGFNMDLAARAALNWVNASQSRVNIHAVSQTTGTHATTIASGSNGVDLSTFTSGSPGTLFVASTQNIPYTSGGTLLVATATGTQTVTYTAANGANGQTSRSSGTQFTGVVAATGTPGSSTMTTGGAVTQALMGTVGYGGTLDSGSKVQINMAGPSTASSIQGSTHQQLGPYVFGTRSGTAQQPSFPNGLWVPSDGAMVTTNFDPIGATANQAIPTAGTLYACRVHCPTRFTATNLIMYVISAGAALTTGQCFAGLYDASGNLVASTVDLSTGANSWASSGAYKMPLTATTSLPAGDYYVGFFFNGTTGPALARGTNAAGNLVNMNLSSPNMRFATANTGLTTALPTTLGAQTASAFSWLVGIN